MSNIDAIIWEEDDVKNICGILSRPRSVPMLEGKFYFEPYRAGITSNSHEAQIELKKTSKTVRRTN
jgi:hypothetical protein